MNHPLYNDKQPVLIGHKVIWKSEVYGMRQGTVTKISTKGVCVTPDPKGNWLCSPIKIKSSNLFRIG